MKKMILLFSHTLNEEQKKDAQDVLGVEEFLYMPQELQKIWSNISPDLDSLDSLLEPIKRFLKENTQESDFVLIQGDFGAVYQMILCAKELRLVPLYATTKRTIKEITNKENQTLKTSIFEHRRFRKYE